MMKRGLSHGTTFCANDGHSIHYAVNNDVQDINQINASVTPFQILNMASDVHASRVIDQWL